MENNRCKNPVDCKGKNTTMLRFNNVYVHIAAKL